jgi:hypothetical protein
MWFFWFHAFSSVTTVFASSTSLTRQSFSVTTGDFVVVSFSPPNGFVVASSPDPTSLNVAQDCSDRDSGSCSWFSCVTPGILSMTSASEGSFSGVAEYRATSTGALVLTYGYLYPTDARFSFERCTLVFVQFGRATIPRNLILTGDSVFCLFTGDVGGTIASAVVTREIRLYNNSGFTGIASVGTAIPASPSTTGVMVDNPGNNEFLGFDLNFSAQDQTYNWSHRYNDFRVSSWPVLYRTGGAHTACLPGRDDGSSRFLTIGGAVVGIALIALIVGVIARTRCRRQAGEEQLRNEKLLVTREGDSQERLPFPPPPFGSYAEPPSYHGSTVHSVSPDEAGPPGFPPGMEPPPYYGSTVSSVSPDEVGPPGFPPGMEPPPPCYSSAGSAVFTDQPGRSGVPPGKGKYPAVPTTI